MIRKKRCVIEGKDDFIYNKKMSCDQEGCFLNDIPEEKFSLWNTNVIHGYKCSYIHKNIIATNSNENVFGTNCIASSYSCKTRREITVWNDTVIHKCPYEIIQLPGRYDWIDD